VPHGRDRHEEDDTVRDQCRERVEHPLAGRLGPQLPTSEATNITTTRTARTADASARRGLSERTKYAIAANSPATTPALITTEPHS
jgi:hypothetical protein